MALDISSLLTAQTSAQIRATMVTQLVSFGIPADQWRSGGVASTMLTVVSIVLAMLSSLIVSFVSGFFLPTSTGATLRALAYYVYGVTVPSATFASGNVTLTNTGGGSFTITAGSLVVLNPTSKIQYVSTNASPITLSPLGTAVVPVAATTAGSVGSSAPGTVTVMVTSLLLVTVTNPTALVGVDAPNDAAVRLLCTNALGVLSVRGVRTAYAYAIQTAVNSISGNPVNINRWAITESSHVGTVTLWVASPAGVPDTNDVTGVATNVEAVARPYGVQATVLAVTPVDYTATINVYAIAPLGTLSTTVAGTCATAVEDYLAAYPIGGVTAFDDPNGTSSFQGLFGSGIAGAIAAGCASASASLVSIKGAIDLALSSGEVAVDEVTIAVTLIPPTAGVLL